jgi:hypothetical protein
MSVYEVEPDWPHWTLPDADWADCFETIIAASAVRESPLTADVMARQAFERLPFWFHGLLKLRNILVWPFGLSSDAADVPDEVERMGIFPVVHKQPREVVLGFDDRHLNFRILVTAEPGGDGATRARMMTLVHRNNALGRVYLAAIMPFHKLIVRTSLARVG